MLVSIVKDKWKKRREKKMITTYLEMTSTDIKEERLLKTLQNYGSRKFLGYECWKVLDCFLDGFIGVVVLQWLLNNLKILNLLKNLGGFLGVVVLQWY